MLKSETSIPDLIDVLPTAQKEGYVFKGWWNREYRVFISPDSPVDKIFDVYIDEPPFEYLTLNGYHTAGVEENIVLVPIWDEEGENESTLTFVNNNVEGFEPLVYKMNVGDCYIAAFAGEFPSPVVYQLDEWTEFVGWYIEEVNFMLTEGDMWEQGYPAIGGNWEFVAQYEEL